MNNIFGTYNTKCLNWNNAISALSAACNDTVKDMDINQSNREKHSLYASLLNHLLSNPISSLDSDDLCIVSYTINKYN